VTEYTKSPGLYSFFREVAPAAAGGYAPPAMRAGVVGLLPRHPREVSPEHVRVLRGLGFSGASIGLGVPGEVPQQDLVQAREVLAAGGIRVAQASASYPPLVHPDEGQRREAIELVRRACAEARALDAVYLLVRSGSVNPGGNYYPHRENHTPATTERLIDSLRRVSATAEGEGVTLGLECHVITTLESPQKVRQIIDAVGSPALRYNADPVNFVSSFADAYDTPAVLRRVFEHLGDYVVSAHVKDVRLGDRLVVHIDECAPGEGIFDLATFMTLYEECRPDGYALIEHLPDAKIPAAKAALDAVLERAGITWRE
jgi:sugar phosphate isomerase/epimerase